MCQKKIACIHVCVCVKKYNRNICILYTLQASQWLYALGWDGRWADMRWTFLFIFNNLQLFFFCYILWIQKNTIIHFIYFKIRVKASQWLWALGSVGLTLDWRPRGRGIKADVGHFFSFLIRTVVFFYEHKRIQ